MEQGLWVKGGSILPILAHQRELSLMNALNNNYRLDVYPNADNYAVGNLYLDDGDSFNHEQGMFTVVHYYFEDNAIWVEKITETENIYPLAATKMVVAVAINGLSEAPARVYNIATKQYVDAAMLLFTEGTLEVSGLELPVDDGSLIKWSKVALLQLEF